MVGESEILLRIEHLEQCCGRVTAEILAEFVNLVQHKQRVGRGSAADGLQNAARQRADIGAPVAADLRFVAHAAQRQANELASQRRGDRLAERGLTGSRRANETQNRLAHALWLQAAHGDIFENAVFCVAQAVVVLV